MKRNKIVVLMVLCASLLVSACNANKATDAEKSQTVLNQQNQAGLSGNNPNGDFRGQNPDLYAEVVGIQGSELELKILVTPKFGGSMQGGQGGRNGGNRGNSAMPLPTPEYTGLVEKVVIPQGVQIFARQRPMNRDNNMMSGQEKMEGKTPDGSQPDGNTTVDNEKNKGKSDERRGQRGRQNGNQGPNQQLLEVKDIKVGDLVNVWYSDKEKKVISRVMVRQVSK